MSLRLYRNLVEILQLGETESRERKKERERIRKVPRLGKSGLSEERPRIRPQLLQFRVLTRACEPENQSVANFSRAARQYIRRALLGRKARRGIFSPSKYFIALPRLGSCIYMWTGRLYIYRKRNAMYTVLPKYACSPKMRDAFVFLRSRSKLGIFSLNYRVSCTFAKCRRGKDNRISLPNLIS